MQVEGGGVLFFWRTPFDAEINNDLLFEVTGQSTYASRGSVDTPRALELTVRGRAQLRMFQVLKLTP
jgi:hypothetical protein